jgi:hypothetical protein
LQEIVAGLRATKVMESSERQLIIEFAFVPFTFHPNPSNKRESKQ